MNILLRVTAYAYNYSLENQDRADLALVVRLEEEVMATCVEANAAKPRWWWCRLCNFVAAANGCCCHQSYAVRLICNAPTFGRVSL